jgi:hypothetical protein
MKYLRIRIELGTSDSTFDIYYDSISSGTRALLYDTGLPATGVTNTALLAGDGVVVSVPDESTSIVLSSTPDAFCSENPNVNTGTYTIPIGCMSYTVSASVGVFNYSYTDCDCNPVTATIDATYGYTEQTFCALQDSVSAGLLTVVDNGYCPEPVAMSMITFGTDTELEACADIVTGEPLVLLTTRYSTNSYLNTGDVVYNGPGLTNPMTWPTPQYYGYTIFPGPQYAWAYVDTSGVVISSGYCS